MHRQAPISKIADDYVTRRVELIKDVGKAGRIEDGLRSYWAFSILRIASPCPISACPNAVENYGEWSQAVNPFVRIFTFVLQSKGNREQVWHGESLNLCEKRKVKHRCDGLEK
jgi:hypothetical protein